MKKVLFLLIIIIGSFFETFAQEIDEGIYINQVTEREYTALNATTEDDFFGFFSTIPFISELQQHAIDASQVAGIKITGNQNIAEISQFGSGNFGILHIDGDDNQAGLVQKGTGLLSVLNVTGNANNMHILQDGNALQNYIEVKGNGINFDVRQTNSGLVYTQSGPIPITIERTGRRVPIIITNN